MDNEIEKEFKSYGAMFESLREQRHFSQEDFKTVGLSAAVLSRFESGGTVLRYDKLDAALELMKIEVGEYEYFTNGFQSDYFIEICNEIEEANYRQDRAKLQAIYEESTKYHQRLISLATKNLLGALTLLEKSEVRDQLFPITDWTYFELFILSFVVEQLSRPMRDSILRDFMKYNLHYMNVPKYREKIFQILCRATLAEIDNRQPARAQELLKNVLARLKTKDVFARCMYLFTQGLWDFKFGDQATGLAAMKSIIEIYERLGNQTLAEYYQRLFKEATHRYKEK